MNRRLSGVCVAFTAKDPGDGSAQRLASGTPLLAEVTGTGQADGLRRDRRSPVLGQVLLMRWHRGTRG